MKRRDFIKLLAGALVMPPVFSKLLPIIEPKKNHISSGGNRIRIPLQYSVEGSNDGFNWKTCYASTTLEKGDMVQIIDGKIAKAEASMQKAFTEAFFKPSPLFGWLRRR